MTMPARELKVVQFRAAGKSWAEIGRELDLAPERTKVLHMQALHRLEQLRIGPPNTPQRFYHLERFGEVAVVGPPRVNVRVRAE